jgi:RNA polymerase sigma-70 factor (ECF subfamily)
MMPAMQGDDSVPPWFRGNREFGSTMWPQVLRAGEHPAPHASEALEALCRNYWAPLYAYLRRTGHPPHEAQDLVQGFFASLIKGGDLKAAAPEKGRFRSFLLGTLKHFLSDERKRAAAQKGGGGQAPVSLDELEQEAIALTVAAGRAEPETAYDRQWAFLLVCRARAGRGRWPGRRNAPAASASGCWRRACTQRTTTTASPARASRRTASR